MQLRTCCHAGQVSSGEVAIINLLICLEIRRPPACFYFARCCPNSHCGLILLKCKLVGTGVRVRQCVCVHVRARMRFWDEGQTSVKQDKNGNHAFCFVFCSCRLSVYADLNLALESLLAPVFITCGMTTSLTLPGYFLVPSMLSYPCASACPTKARPCLESQRLPK